MSAIAALVRLTRPVNLLIIAATMYGLRWFILKPLATSASIGMKLELPPVLFFISCLVMILLAAGGNVINDYFDRKVDKINKPDRVIVGKTVKRRVAIILHQLCNILSVGFTVILCLYTHLWAALIFPVVIATLLWWYSPVLKKKPLIGNITVALCVAAVPVWTGYFEINLLRHEYYDMLAEPEALFSAMWKWMFAYAGFAFILTLIREALKDMEDMEGDRDGGYQTMPLLSIETTRKYIASLIFIVIGLVAFCAQKIFRPFDQNISELTCVLLLVVFPLVVTLIKSLRANNKKDYSSASKWTKIAMAGGIIFMYCVSLWLNA